MSQRFEPGASSSDQSSVSFLNMTVFQALILETAHWPDMQPVLWLYTVLVRRQTC